MTERRPPSRDGRRTASGGATPGRRGVTTALRYALFLVIVTLLIAGLYIGVGGFVENQQERAIGAQLETVGNRLAADLGTASRLVERGNTSAAGSPTVALQVRLPDAVATSAYRVEITGSGSRYELTLRSFDPTVRTSVVLRSSVPIAGTATGGQVRISYDASADRIEVDNA